MNYIHLQVLNICLLYPSWQKLSVGTSPHLYVHMYMITIWKQEELVNIFFKSIWLITYLQFHYTFSKLPYISMIPDFHAALNSWHWK